MIGLDGKIALVTGVGRKRSIGRGIALRLAKEGADVVINNITNQESEDWGGMREIVGEIQAMGRRCTGILADVSDSAQVSKMIAQAIDEFGRIDVLVNNAGSPVGRDRVPVVELEESLWDLVQRCNVKSTFLCSQAIARHMLERGDGGRIINVASVAGKHGSPRYAAYCASKFAVVGFTQALAAELASHGITVNSVCPGVIDTERSTDIAVALAPAGTPVDQARAAYDRRLTPGIPVGRQGTGADVAGVVAFLASDDADFLTGVSVPITGGQYMW